MRLYHLTNEEVIANLRMRNDLTQIEHELLDRLVRAQEALLQYGLEGVAER